MSDDSAALTWVERTVTVDAIDSTKDAIEANPGWRLLHVGMGPHGQTTLTYGWPWQDVQQSNLERKDKVVIEEINPIENGVQQAYQEIRSSLDLILTEVMGHLTVQIPMVILPEVTNEVTNEVLTSLDDAVSNNWDELMLAFWRGVAQDVELMEGETMLAGGDG